VSTPNQPAWLVPPNRDMLTNKRGGVGDTIAESALYANPLSGSSDQVACILVDAKRTARASGTLQTAEDVWNSGWTGTPPVEGIPTTTNDVGPVCATSHGRVYVLFLGSDAAGGSGNCYSAPLVGGGVGAWRPESGLGPTGNWFGWKPSTELYSAGATQMVAANDHLYAIVSTTTTSTQAVVMQAAIAGDGSVGPWSRSNVTFPYALHSGGQFCGGWAVGGWGVNITNWDWVVFLVGGTVTGGTVTNVAYQSAINADGSLGGWQALPSIGGNRRNGSCYWDSNWPAMYIVGGDDGTNVATAVLYAQWRPDIWGSINGGAWSTTTNGLPAGRTQGALVATLGPDYLTHLWYLGGKSAVGGADQSTVYHTSLSGGGNPAVWTTSTALPAAASSLVAFSGSTPGSTFQFGSVGDAGGASGATKATAWVGAYPVSSAVYAANLHAGSPAWRTGDAPGLTTTDLGSTGASITTNADSTQSLGWNHGGFGGAMAALNFGDRLQLSVQFISKKGFVSPAAYTVLNVGQAPTVGSVSPAGGATPSNGQPPLSFAYTPGTGGQGQYRGRIAVRRDWVALVNASTPTGFWRLGEAQGATTAADQTGNALNGTYNGIVTLGGVSALGGESDGSASFGGTGYVALPSSALLDRSGTAAFSIEAWVKTATDVPAGSNPRIYDRELFSPRNGIGLWLAQGPIVGVERWAASASDTLTSPSAISLNAWHHIVATYDGTNLRLYVDGVQVNSMASSKSIASITTAAALAGTPGSANGFPLQLDEVAFYSTALSAAVVADHYAAGPAAYDSLDYYNGQNSVAPLPVAPLLKPSTTYALVCIAESQDDPVSGSTDTATSRTTFTTTAFSPPAAPASLTVTPNAARGSLDCSWASVGGSSFYRLYHRRSGQTPPPPWMLMADLGVGPPSAFVAMDDVALGVAYDLAVSAGANSIESALSSVATATATVSPNRGYIHVAGQGATYGCLLNLEGDLQVTRQLGAAVSLGEAQAMPNVRYSSADYRELAATFWLYDAVGNPFNLKALQQIIKQVRQGAVAVYRDSLGHVIPVAFPPGQVIDVVSPRLRLAQLKMIQVPKLTRPYVIAGLAQGYATLNSGYYGSVDPLDDAEFAV
jgi:hypothetical protein